MMNGPEILRDIVVKVSPDRKKIRGTGFLISKDEIATCYHVLADKGSLLSERYYVKNDAWEDWLEVRPSKEKCHPPPQDIAFLQCPVSLKLVREEIPILPWDGNPCEFRSRGYDCNTTADDGSSTVHGNDCEIIDYTSRGGESRLQLKTIKRTLLQGRSGSPVWSMNQSAIVGMIDYQAGDENIWTDRSMAIPIEAIIPIAKLSAVKKKVGQLINVPQLPPNFLTRPDDLKAVKKALMLDSGQSTAITGTSSRVGLHGMGGIGKSVLAVSVARDQEVQSWFQDGIIWLTLGTDSKILRRQSDLAEMLDGRPHAFEDVEQGKTYLSKQLAHKACLIILDDVWHVEDIKALFSDLGPQCRILVTTRDAGIMTALGAREYRLDLLSPDKALELLAKWAEKDIAALPPEASLIVLECGRLPLALALCGAQAMDGVSWKDLLEALQEAALQFLDHPHGSVMKSMKVSIDNLSTELAKCYQELVVFPPDESWPEAAILTLWTYANSKLKERDVRQMISMLNRKALLKTSVKDGGTTIDLHDLQHDYLRAICEDNAQGLHRLLLDAYAQKTSQGGWPTGPDDGYFFQHLAYHLLQAGKEDDLRALLLDFNWMRARLLVTDVTGLIHDYDFLQSQQDIFTIQGAIRLSAHVLFRDAGQLPGQLLGRLMEQDLPQIQYLLERMPSRIHDPWLRPLIQSLTPPGGPLIQTLQGHIGLVGAVAVTSDGKKAISGASDGTLKIWDLITGKEIQTLRGHIGSVRAVAFIPNGKKAVSGSLDRTLKIWDLTSQEIQTLSGHTGPVNAVAVTSDGKKAVSGSGDRTLKIWDLESGQEIQTIQDSGGPIRAVAFAPNGKRVVSRSLDGTLKVWDLESGQEIQTIQSSAGPVKAVAFTPNGKKMISGSLDGTLKVWDLESGQEIQTFGSHTGWIRAVAITPNGKKAISSDDRTLKVWDLESGQEIQILQGHTGRVMSVAVTSDGKKAISGSADRTLKVWNLESVPENQTLGDHDSLRVRVVAVIPNGKKAISGSLDGTLKVWDLESGREIQILRGHTRAVRAVAVAFDGKKAISLSEDRTLKVWDLESGQEIQTVRGLASSRIRAVAVTPDGKNAISGSDDGTLKVWDMESVQEIQILGGHTSRVSAVVVTSDGKKAVSISSDRTIKVWDLEIWEEIQTIRVRGHTGLVSAMVVTPDGKKAISLSDDRTLKVWDLENGRNIQTLRGHTGRVNAVAVTPNGNKAVSGSDDGTLKIWDLKTGREIQTLKGHTSRVKTVAVTPNGKKAFSGSDDRTLKVWDLESGRMMVEFACDGPINSFALSPDGRTVIAGDVSGRVHLLRLENVRA